PEAAVALREVDPRQAAVELLAQEDLRLGRPGRTLLEQLLDELDDALLVGGQGGFGHGHRVSRYPRCRKPVTSWTRRVQLKTAPRRTATGASWTSSGISARRRATSASRSRSPRR